MITLLKTIVGTSDPEVLTKLEQTLESNRDLLSKQEVSMIEYVIKDYKVTGSYSHPDLFKREFTELAVSFDKAEPLTLDSVGNYLMKIIDRKKKQHAASELMQMSQRVLNDGVTFEDVEKVRSYVQEANDEDDEDSKLSLADRYRMRKSQSLGVATTIPEIDQIIGGISKGLVGVLGGFSGQFKTTWAVNMFYHNTYDNGYNGVYVSLEVPKDDIMYNILSCHSSLPKFSKFPFIGHERIRKGLLSDEEEAYLWDVVYKDLMENSKGKFVILDETDFDEFSFGAIRNKLEQLDDEMDKQLDMVIWDHANLFKFNQGFRNLSQGDIINQYVSYIRRMGIRWRRDPETHQWRKLVNIILAQCNRTGWQKAVKNGGRYTLTALSEANELERCASYVLMSFTTEDMKIAHEASVQLLKSRYGQTIYDPINVFADPEAYVFGEQDSSLNLQVNESAFDQMFNVDPTALGMSDGGALDLSEFDD